MVSESHVTWATSVPIFVFLGLSVLDLGPMYATDRQTDVRHASSLNASALWGRSIITIALLGRSGYGLGTEYYIALHCTFGDLTTPPIFILVSSTLSNTVLTR